MARIVITEGDSWTAGDIIDPVLVEQGLTHINAKQNDKYRLPRVWPGKLQNFLGVPVVNNAVAGSSNDGILRRLFNEVPKYLNDHRSKDIVVIVGFTSPERRDFCSKEGWDTIYPLEVKSKSEAANLREEFQSIYTELYWRPEDYITRYINTVLSAYYFLSSLKVKFLFFNAFYENDFGLRNKHTTREFIESFKEITEHGRLKYLNLDKSIDSYLDVHDKHFLPTSFLRYIKTKGSMDSTEYFYRHHPTEISHVLWADHIYNHIKKW